MPNERVRLLRVVAAWAFYNYALLSCVRDICVPQTTIAADGQVVIGEPALLSPAAVDAHLELPMTQVLMKVTNVLAKATGYEAPSENEHQRLFGAAGEKGPELLLLLLKLQAWLLVASFVFCFMSILSPDIASICSEGPTMLAVGELVVFGQFWLVYTTLLVLVTPATFTLYTIFTAIEGFQKDEAIEHARHMSSLPVPVEPQATVMAEPKAML